MRTLGCDKIMEDVLLVREVYGHKIVTSQSGREQLRSRSQSIWSGV